MPGGAPGPHEIRRDDRLPVAGRERVHGAPEHRDADRDQDEPDPEVAMGHEVGERSARDRHALAAASARRADRHARPGAVPVAERRRPHVERRREHPRGVVPQHVGHVVRRGGRLGEDRPGRGPHDDLLPPHPVSERVVRERGGERPVPRDRRAERDVTRMQCRPPCPMRNVAVTALVSGTSGTELPFTVRWSFPANAGTCASAQARARSAVGWPPRSWNVGISASSSTKVTCTEPCSSWTRL